MRTPWQLHIIALLVVVATLAAETVYLFLGTPAIIPDVLIGRILGTLDAALLLVLNFYFASSIMQSRGSQRGSDASPAPPPPLETKGPA